MDADGIAILHSLWDSLDAEYGLASRSRVKPGVKRGGLTRKDGYVLDRYISFKNARGLNLALSFRIATKDRRPFYFMDLRDTSKRGVEPLLSLEFAAADHLRATQRYRKELGALLG